MDSNIDLTVDDNEVPQKTDHQSDNGLSLNSIHFTYYFI